MQVHELAALRLDRQCHTERQKQRRCPGTSSDNNAVRRNRCIAQPDTGDTIAVANQFGVALDRAGAEALHRTQQSRRHASSVDASAIRNMQARKIGTKRRKQRPGLAR
jgi:hypothetical protein